MLLRLYANHQNDRVNVFQLALEEQLMALNLPLGAIQRLEVETLSGGAGR